MDSSSSAVVVTGVGALTSTGSTAQESYQAILQGKTGIAPVQQWDSSPWEYPLGAEIKEYNARQLIEDRKLLKLISKQDVIGLNAVKQALNDSSLLPYRETLDAQGQTLFNDRTGVFVGSPGNRFEQQYDFLPVFNDAKGNMKVFAEKVFEHIHPMWLLRILPNNVLAYVGIQFGFKGTNENIVNHAISGVQAIAEACRYLRQGMIDRAVVVAYECGVEPEGQIYYGSLGLLSPQGIFSFDQRRNGTVLAEGAGCLILEREESAKQRQAKIYGQILSDAVVTEAQGIFSIREDGNGVKRAMEIALERAHLSAQEIGMIVGHGNGTLISDSGEAAAIKALFGEKSTPTTGFKWSLGHTLTAAGTIETIMALLALNNKQIPGLASFTNASYDCTALDISQQTRTLTKSTAMLISRGFSSVDACLVIKAGS